MAKQPTISTIASGFYSTQKLNENFTAIRDKFDEFLSLQGDTPNSMSADLDVNSQDILNAKNINANGLYLNGQLVTALESSANDIVYNTVELLQASTEAARGTGSLWVASDWTFEEVASGESFTTAGGVKLLRQTNEVERSAPITANARARLDADVPSSGLPQTIKLEKLRTDYSEFSVFTPMTYDGRLWNRWYHTNRIGNSNATGAPRNYTTSEVGLYDSSIVSKVADNWSSGTMGTSSTGTQATSSGTRTGTWTGSATVDGVTDIRYSTVAGDKVVYTVTGTERIAWRAYKNGGNGGWVEILIEESSVEIASANYDVPVDSGTSRRTVKLDNTSLSNGQVEIPLASGLDSSDTYTVTITVDASNPSGGRSYDGGITEYADIAYNTTGLHGRVQEKTVGSTTGNLMYWSGLTVVYEVTDATRIDWNFIQGSNFSTADFKVYDNTGTEISTYENQTHDTNGSQILSAVTVCKGLTKGTYYIHISPSSTAIGNDQRIYDVGVKSYDETVAGDITSDEFDLQGQAVVLSDATTYGQSNLIFGGNTEYAVQFATTDRTLTDNDFVTGVHNTSANPTEANPTNFVVKVDGTVVDYANASQYDSWTGELIEITFSTVVSDHDTGTAIVRLDWTLNYSAAGYQCQIVENITAATVYSGIHYGALMLVSPNRDTSVTVALQGQLGNNVGGGFDSRYFDGWGTDTPADYDNSSYAIDQRCLTIAHYNDEYVVAATILNPQEIDRGYVGEADYQTTWSSYNDRVSGTSKGYVRSYRVPSNGRILRLQGDTATFKKSYRCYKGRRMKTLLGA